LSIFRKQLAVVIRARNAWLNLRYGVKIGPNVRASLSSRFHSRRRGAITVGADTLIAFKALLTTYDPLTGQDRDIRVGERCFIGGGAILLPGVTIGDETIVGSGAVVTGDIPSRCIAGGNPARILRQEIEVGPWGRLKGADERTRAFWKPAG
jgi:acetyltransferase-like isoleucine patch superfamily enzyme